MSDLLTEDLVDRLVESLKGGDDTFMRKFASMLCCKDALDEHGSTVLHIAARRGDNFLANSLLSLRLSSPASLLLSVKDSDGNCPAHIAAEGGHLSILQTFHHTNAESCVIVGRLKRSIVHIGAIHGNVDVVSAGIDLGIDVALTDLLGNTALHLASWNGHVAVMEALINRNSSILNLPNKISKENDYREKIIKIIRKSNETNDDTIVTSMLPREVLVRQWLDEVGPFPLAQSRPLLRSFSYLSDDSTPSYHQGFIRFVVDEGIDYTHIGVSEGNLIEISSHHHNTPLHLAALTGHTQAVSCLLGHGATVDCRNNRNATPLLLALLAAGGGVTDSNKNSESYKTSIRTVIDLLIHAGASMSVANSHGNSVLHYAALSGDDVLFKKLISLSKTSEGSTNGLLCRNLKGSTPLHYAASRGHIKILDILMTNLSSSNPKLMKSSSGASTSPVGSPKLSPYSRSSAATPPLSPAKSPSSVALLKLSSSSSSSTLSSYLNESNYAGDTPLHLACRCGHVAIVHHLIKNGSNIDSVDSAGRSPIGIAAGSGNTDCASIMVNGVDGSGLTPLHRFLIHLHILSSSADSHDPQALQLAEQLEQRVKEMIEQGAHVDERCYVDAQASLQPDDVLNHPSVNAIHGLTPLEIVLFDKNIKLLKVLIGSGCNIELGCPLWQCLHRLKASEGLDSDTVFLTCAIECLLKGGADPNNHPPSSASCMDLVLSLSNLHHLKCLLQNPVANLTQVLHRVLALYSGECQSSNNQTDHKRKDFLINSIKLISSNSSVDCNVVINDRSPIDYCLALNNLELLSWFINSIQVTINSEEESGGGNSRNYIFRVLSAWCCDEENAAFYESAINLLLTGGATVNEACISVACSLGNLAILCRLLTLIDTSRFLDSLFVMDVLSECLTVKNDAFIASSRQSFLEKLILHLCHTYGLVLPQSIVINGQSLSILDAAVLAQVASIAQLAVIQGTIVSPILLHSLLKEIQMGAISSSRCHFLESMVAICMIGKVDVNSVNEEGKTPLAVAVMAGNDVCVKVLLAHGAIYGSDMLHGVINELGTVTAASATRKLFLETMATSLITAGADCSLRLTDDGPTPLELCLKYYLSTLACLMINHRANVFLPSPIDGHTPVSLVASEMGSTSATPARLVFLEAVAVCLTANGVNILHEVIINSRGLDTNKNLILKLIQNGGDINMKSVIHEGDTPIHTVAKQGWFNILKLLVPITPTAKSCANLLQMNNKNETSVHCAISYGHVPLAMYLISYMEKHYAADTNWLSLLCSPPRDISLLHHAVYTRSFDLISLLLEKMKSATTELSALINIPSQHGNTLLHLLLQSCNDVDGGIFRGEEERILSLLISYECNVNVKNDYGVTVLMLAIEGGYDRAVMKLIDSGVDLTCINLSHRVGYTYLHVAIDYNRMQLLESLLKLMNSYFYSNSIDFLSYILCRIPFNMNLFNLFVKKLTSNTNTTKMTEYCYEMLWIGCYLDNVDVVTHVLSLNTACITHIDRHSRSILHWMACWGAGEGRKHSLSILMKLSDAVSNKELKSSWMNAVDNNKHSAVYLAAIHGHSDLYSLLLRHDVNQANVNDVVAKCGWFSILKSPDMYEPLRRWTDISSSADVISQLSTVTEAFVDLSFLPCSTSFFNVKDASLETSSFLKNISFASLEWTRLSMLTATPCQIGSTPKSTDLQCDSYLSSVMFSIISHIIDTYPQLVTEKIIHGGNGWYIVTVPHPLTGEFTDVVIDDYVPIVAGSDHPAILWSKQGMTSIWPCLLLKGYAKLCGSYFAASLGYNHASFEIIHNDIMKQSPSVCPLQRSLLRVAYADVVKVAIPWCVWNKGVDVGKSDDDLTSMILPYLQLASSLSDKRQKSLPSGPVFSPYGSKTSMRLKTEPIFRFMNESLLEDLTASIGIQSENSSFPCGCVLEVLRLDRPVYIVASTALSGSQGQLSCRIPCKSTVPVICRVAMSDGTTVSSSSYSLWIDSDDAIDIEVRDDLVIDQPDYVGYKQRCDE